ncbi:MAG: hypothetical protein KatS3mg131_3770 [Candidatus Tectimicrobiota bacterium]|nr:MAG: hypothetical protein KatS3mg131_3770 [Candidatus Tectomicrobia bacterium]
MSLSAALAFGSALLCAVLAGVTWWKAPPSAVTRLFVAGMGLLAAREALAALYLDGVLPWALWQRALWLAEALIPLVWLLFSLCFGRANWRQLLRRWRWALGAAGAFPFALLLSTGGLLGWAPEALAPPGVLLRLNWAGRLLVLWDLLLSLAILANLESTLRAAGGIKRWQVKFVLLGVGSIFAAQVYTDSQSLLFSSLYVRLETVQSCALAAATVLLALGLVRSRLLHVDLYLSRTALYGSLTVLVAGGYLVAVGLLARVIRDVGHSEVLPLSTLFMFLALLGLMVVLLSNQLRQQLKGFVSRHFYRSRYDYRHEWATFHAADGFGARCPRPLCRGVAPRGRGVWHAGGEPLAF